MPDGPRPEVGKGGEGGEGGAWRSSRPTKKSGDSENTAERSPRSRISAHHLANSRKPRGAQESRGYVILRQFRPQRPRVGREIRRSHSPCRDSQFQLADLRVQAELMRNLDRRRRTVDQRPVEIEEMERWSLGGRSDERHDEEAMRPIVVRARAPAGSAAARPSGDRAGSVRGGRAAYSGPSRAKYSRCQTRRPTPARHRVNMPQLPRLPRPVRRAFLVAHVTVSVGWLGISLCLLTLAVAGVRDPEAFAEPASIATKLFADWLLVPVALLSLVTGLVLSLGTPWGLARHRWVWVKFWLTLVATGLTVFAFEPGADEAAALAAAGEHVPGTDLLFPPAVSLSLYVFLTAVSVLKPWGPTRRGRRLRDARARRGAASTPSTGPGEPSAGKPVAGRRSRQPA